MGVIKLYAIVKADGTLRGRRGYDSPKIYRSRATAQRNATVAGDSVVECEIDLTRAPLFIRGQAL